MKFINNFEFTTYLEEFKHIDCTFQNGRFARIDILDASVQNVIFKDVSFLKAEFTNWNFTNCVFENCAIDRLTINKENMHNVSFMNCTICKFSLFNIDVRDLLIQECRLDRFWLVRCTISNLIADNCRLAPQKPNSKFNTYNGYLDIEADESSLRQLQSVPFHSLEELEEQKKKMDN